MQTQFFVVGLLRVHTEHGILLSHEHVLQNGSCSLQAGIKRRKMSVIGFGAIHVQSFPVSTKKKKKKKKKSCWK